MTVECDEDGADHLSDIYGKVVSDAISVRLYAYLQDMESRLMRRQDLVLQQIKKQIEEELLVIKDTSNRKGEDNNLQSFKVKESILHYIVVEYIKQFHPIVKEQERSLRTSWHGDDMTTINNLVIPAAMLLAIGLFVVQLSSFFNQSFHDRMPPYH